VDIMEITELIIDVLPGGDRRALAELAGYDPDFFEELVACFLKAGIQALSEELEKPRCCPVIPLYPVHAMPLLPSGEGQGGC
jgi:hypothetical protein